MKHVFYLIIIDFVGLCLNYRAQTDTSTNIFYKPEKKHVFLKISNWSEPKKASVWSAVIPGAGQIYNKKYWKVPILYAIGGFLTYHVIHKNNQYLYYKQELIKVLNGGSNAEGLSSQQLALLKNQNKKWRDLSIAGVLLTYIVNIIDANVDAHLKKFDVSDDLSLSLKPNFYLISTTQNFTIHISLTVKF